MGKTKTYDEYKPTDIGWLPAIPSQWEIVDTKRCFSFPKEIVGSDFNSYKVLSLSVNGVIFRDMASGAGKHHSDMGTYQIVRPETIVLCLFDMDVTPRIVGHSDKTGIITSAYVNIAPKENTVSKYYYYYFLLQDFNNYLFSQGTGIRTTLTRSQFGSLKIALPSKEEQAKIAAFLDFKLAKIDRFIRKKKQLIKLLNEQKAAIINQAVTKGLNPNAKMKSSGIEWLGDIPEHWNLKRLRFLLLSGDKGIKIGPFGSAIKSDIIHSKEFYISKGVKCFKVYGQEHAIASDFNIGNKYISEESYQKLSGYTLMSGDIIITMMGTIGKSKVVPDNVEDGIMDSHLIRIGINPETSSYYISFLINDSACLSENMRYESKGSIMSGLNSKIIKSLYIPLPPIVEQQQIIEYIEKEISKLNQTVSTIVKEINLVEEYKTALIAEAVTGKINVRDFEIPKTLEVEIYDELEEELSMVAEEEAEYETKDIE